jgi:hypothetical protein
MLCIILGSGRETPQSEVDPVPSCSAQKIRKYGILLDRAASLLEQPSML